MQYEILISSGNLTFTAKAETFEYLAMEIFRRVEDFKTNYVNLFFSDEEKFADDFADFKARLFKSFELLMAKDGCHLGSLVKLDVERDCDGEYAHYDIEGPDGRGCSLTLEIK